jgi:hypothetical protein
MIMSTLTALKLVAAKKPRHLPAIQQRRNRLGARIWEQIQLARSQGTGDTFMPRRWRSVRDATTGQRTEVEVRRRIRPWWWVNEAGRVCVHVRYGSRVLELSRGKSAVEVTSAEELISALEALKQAVESGELDHQIEAASGAVRQGFRGK